MEVKLANAPIGVSFDITAGQQGNYGYGVNNVPISYGIPLEKDEKKTFTTVQVLNVGDPLRIYAAPSLLDVNLGNFIEYVSTLNITGVYTESLGTKLKSLNLGVDSKTNTKRNTSLKVISGLASAKSLETLNIEGYQGITSLDFTELKKLKTLNSFASGITSVSLFDGSPIELLELPSTIQSISLVNANRIPSSGLVVDDSWKSVTTINIRNCQGLCSDFNLVKTWFTNKTTANSKCSLTMEGVAWTNVNPTDLISLAALKTDGGVLSLKGTIRLSSIALEQIDQIKALYGDNVFTKGSELFVSAPDTAFILGTKGIVEGDSLQLSSVVVSEYQGSVTWSIASGSGASINQSGLLTTTETGSARTIVVQLKHTPTQGNAVTTTTNISVAKAVRPTSVSVNGTGRMSSDSEYTLSVSPTGINRDYSVDWSIKGTAYTDGYVAIKSSDKDSCIVKMVNAKGYGKVELTATITMDNGSKLQSTKVIFVGTTLTVNISSNQGTDSTISAVKANVTFGSTTLEATSGKYMHIPVGESIKVSYPKVDGYTQPSDYTFTSTTADATTSATYSTTIVSVTMSDNQTSLNDIANVKAIVKYDSVSTSLASGGSVKIPTGKSVTITWGAVSGYTTPAKNTFTATGTSMQYEGVYNTTIVTVKMADNQTDYNDIASATATVAASGMTTATVSNNGTAKVPTGSSCTITWSVVSGYKTPDKQTFTTSGTSVTKTGTYQTEILTVNVTSDIDLPSSFTITVSGIGSQTTASKVYKVPFGTSYTVSASAADGYKTPTSQSFTANNVSRTVIVEYLRFIPVTTIRINQNISDPSTMITCIEDGGSIEAIRSNSHRYTGILNSDKVMVLKQLDDSDGTKYVDGSSIDLSTAGVNVWMKLPQFYWKCEEISEDVWDFSVVYGIKPDRSFKKWEGNDLIGVYKASGSRFSWRSLPNKIIALNSPGNLLDTNDHYHNITWRQHCMLSMLYYTYYKNTNCRQLLGESISSFRNTYTGFSDSMCMTDSMPVEGETNVRVNFWGIEDAFGHQEIVSNAKSINGQFVVTEDGTERVLLSSEMSGNVSKFVFGEHIDLVPKSVDGTSTTGFCLGFYFASSTEKEYFFGRSCDIVGNDGLASGVAWTEKYGESNYSSRICYNGDYIIEEPPVNLVVGDNGEVGKQLYASLREKYGMSGEHFDITENIIVTENGDAMKIDMVNTEDKTWGISAYEQASGIALFAYDYYGMDNGFALNSEGYVGFFQSAPL